MSELDWTPVTVTIDQLIPWEHNPKTSTAKQQQQLNDSKTDLGQFQTIAIGPFNGNGKAPVYDGHQRLSAWKAKHGGGVGLVALQASRPLTDQERRKVAIYSRQIGAWDWDVLSGWEPAELTAWGFDVDLLSDWRRDVAALGNFLESEEPPEPGDAEPQTNRAEELRQEWGVELGQLWRLPSRTSGQEHRLICGDCTDAAVVERVMGGERAEIALLDPPYGMRLDADFSGMKNNLKFAQEKGLKNGRQYDNVIGDWDDYDASLLAPIIADIKEQIWFGANYYASTLPDTEHSGCWLVWDKRLDESADKMFGSCFELIWSKGKHKQDILRHKWAGVFGTEHEPVRGRAHPNQKPVELYKDLLNRYGGNIAFDGYCGSGNSLLAAENLARQCRAVEISPAYVAVALQRYLDAFGIRAELITEKLDG